MAHTILVLVVVFLLAFCQGLNDVVLAYEHHARLTNDKLATLNCESQPELPDEKACNQETEIAL